MALNTVSPKPRYDSVNERMVGLVMNSVSGLCKKEKGESWAEVVTTEKKGTHAKPVDRLTPATTADKRSASIA